MLAIGGAWNVSKNNSNQPNCPFAKLVAAKKIPFNRSTDFPKGVARRLHVKRV
jgi:hypothetical protein